MYSRLSLAWSKAALVNNAGDPTQVETKLYLEKEDYNEELLPFVDHPLWQSCDEVTKSKVLSYAWILYNRKTIFIEYDIVLPACEVILKNSIPGLDSSDIATSVSEAVLDEAMHIKMSSNACNVISDFRQLERLRYKDFNLVRERERMLQDSGSQWERNIISLSIACASETLVTDYLSLLSEDFSIQDICRQVTKAHADDEALHSTLFSQLMCDFVSSLDNRGKSIVEAVVPKAAELFANNELTVWEGVLKHCGIKGVDEMISDIGSQNTDVCLEGTQRFIERCGLNDSLLQPSVSYFL